MSIRAFTVAVLAVLAACVPSAASAAPVTPQFVAASMTSAAVATTAQDDGDGDVTRPTVNEFFPEERPLSECLGSLPKPDCGSKARGGWAQTAVFLAIMAGLAFIAWRIVAGSRRARAAGHAPEPTREPADGPEPTGEPVDGDTAP